MQINNKEATISLGTTQYALINTIAGKVGTWTISSATLDFLSGNTSSIQTQMNNQEATISLGTTQYALINTIKGKVGTSTISLATLNFLSGVTSSIQTQLNNRLPISTAGDNITKSSNNVISSYTSSSLWSDNTTHLSYGNIKVCDNFIKTSSNIDGLYYIKRNGYQQYDTCTFLEDGIHTNIMNCFTTGDSSNVEYNGVFHTNNLSEVFTFYTASDDESFIYIDGDMVVNNGGVHWVVKRSGSKSLNANTYYPIQIKYGDGSGGNVLSVYFSQASVQKTSNGLGYYYHQNSYKFINKQHQKI